MGNHRGFWFRWFYPQLYGEILTGACLASSLNNRRSIRSSFVDAMFVFQFTWVLLVCRIFISVLNLHVLDPRLYYTSISSRLEKCVCVCVCVCVGGWGGGGGGIEIHFRESREAKLFDYDRWEALYPEKAVCLAVEKMLICHLQVSQFI